VRRRRHGHGGLEVSAGIEYRPCGPTLAKVLCLLVVFLPSCARDARCVGHVSEVTYHIWTGHVVPSWSEEYVISEAAVRLTRTSEPGSEVNAGAWEFAVDPQRVLGLFAQLEAVDWASVREMPPAGPSPDGGGSTSYQIKCERGTGRSLWYREGWTYAGAEVVTRVVQEFVAGLTLPADAGRFSSATTPD
jgi:hypothetical protein